MISGVFLIDWLLISLSLFNAISLVWLTLTVVLNADRRTWGVWLMGNGLAMGALFFISHSVILGHELTVFGSQDLEVWWRVGWLPVILSPYLWYVVILWYAGFWDGWHLYRRHRIALAMLSMYAVGLLLSLLFVSPLPRYAQVTVLDFSHTIRLAGIPLLFLVYPPFGVLCILLPVDVLNHPEPSRRMMGDLARQRARPWLFGVTAVLLAVSLLLAAFILWAATVAGSRPYNAALSLWIVRGVALFDLLLSAMIAAAGLLLGRAIISYEIFTGKTLPRRGFFRQWRSAMLLSAGLAVTVGYTLIWQPLPVFSLLLATFTMVTFYAISNWRSFVNRDEFMARLHPFVSSQRLMHQLIETEDDSASRANGLFCAVCEDVLGAAQACLVPLGALAPLAGPPLCYPPTADAPPPFSPDLFADIGTELVPLDPDRQAGLLWAIPLRSERGLIGALLLGPKWDGGLYTQEEVEIAQSSAERIVDMLAGEQVARRLADIQRRRLAETRVLDLRTRRALHDEVLPALHTVALQLSGLAHQEPAAHQAIQTLTEIHHQISDLIHTSTGAFSLSGGQRSGLLGALRAMVDEEFDGAFDAVEWHADGEVPPLDPLLREVIWGAAREAIRNAALHGRGGQLQRPLTLTVTVRCEDRLSITVCDDGVGLAHFSSAALPSGSGGGLTLHSTMLAIAGGELSIESTPERGTQVIISAPVIEPPGTGALVD